MPQREFKYHWQFDLRATPEQLWPYVADTNRFNRDTGVPKLEIEAGPRRLPNARRRVRLLVYGVSIEWEEQPFEWVKPHRFGVDRTYSKGPMTRMRALVELSPAPQGGTHLSYKVWATPRNFLGTLAIPLQIGLVSSKRFRAAFEEYDRLACSSAKAAIRQLEPSPTVDRRLLSSLAQRLVADLSGEHSTLVDQFVRFLETSDDFAAARIRPYQLADEWNRPRGLLLEMCLRATRIGLLDLQWDQLCPLCRGAKESNQTLREISDTIHCSTCKIDFKVNFERFVELTFRPNAAVRTVDVQQYCVGSPEGSPHVVAQQLLNAGEQRSLELPLEAGNYRARTLELPGSQIINVSPGGATAGTFTIGDEGLVDRSVSVGERSTFNIQNQTNAEQLFILERLAWSDQAATAAEVTALQVFRDLFATEALRPGNQISVGTLTILFTDLRHSTRLYREIGDASAFGRVMNHFDVLKNAITAHDGAVVKTIGDAVMGVFRRPAQGLLAMIEAQELLAQPPDGTLPLVLKAGLHSGPCIAVTLNDRLDYFGSTVNLAARLESLSTGSDVVISRAIFDDPRVSELLAGEQFETEPFEMALKGFDEDRFELWRVKRKGKGTITRNPEPRPNPKD